VPNEFTDAKLEEMVGHYKRSKWMAEREVLQARERRLAGDCGDADLRRWGLGIGSRLPARRKDYSGFSEGEELPGYVGDGTEFRGEWKSCARRATCWRRSMARLESDICWERKNLTLKGLLDLLAKITGLAGAGDEQYRTGWRWV